MTDIERTKVPGGQGGLLRQIAEHLQQSGSIDRDTLVRWCKDQAGLLNQEAILMDHYSDQWAKEERRAWDMYVAAYDLNKHGGSGQPTTYQAAGKWADHLLAERGIRFAP